jgi:GntR family transcriptional regulator
MKDTMSRPKLKTSDDLLNLLSAIDLQSSIAVYAQIENHVQFAIASGRLKPGDQLPAVRELAERLRINTNTVSKAYRDMVVMGLLFTRRGMGVFVATNLDDKTKEECRRRVLMHLNEVICEVRAAGFEDKDIVDITEKCLKSKTSPFAGLPASLQSYTRPRRR